MSKRTGTKEWSEHSKNTHIGCENNCRYCYARSNALRYKHVENEEEWENMKRNKYSQNETFKKLDGRIMYPTTHDILPDMVDDAIEYLKGWLEEGNEVLIVSKPLPLVISKLCANLSAYREQIVYRFTIGSMMDDSIQFWERNSPLFRQRIQSLEIANTYGFTTSVSCEPYLDYSIVELLNFLIKRHMVTDTIWVGKMNKVESRVNMDGWGDKEYKYLKRVKAVQTDEFVEYLYAEFNQYEQVHWKDSIKDVLGLEPEPVG